jgi:hypothetical protein
MNAAEQEFAQSLVVFEGLTALDPSNADWQANLSAVRGRLS